MWRDQLRTLTGWVDNCICPTCICSRYFRALCLLRYAAPSSRELPARSDMNPHVDSRPLPFCKCPEETASLVTRMRLIVQSGGGMAGITAAVSTCANRTSARATKADTATQQALHNASISDFVIIEYQDRIGGRAKETHFGEQADGSPYTVELGANWVRSSHCAIRIPGSGPLTSLPDPWARKARRSREPCLVIGEHSVQLRFRRPRC